MKVPLPCSKLLPMVEVAMSLPEASVASKEPLRPVNHVVANVESVEEALAKVERPVKTLAPEKVLLFASNVDDAAVIVAEPPSAIEEPLTVTLEFWSCPLPIVEVETIFPF